jgi:hypothetical protein
MGGPPGAPGGQQQTPQNKVQRIKPADVWGAIKKSLGQKKSPEDRQD